MPFRLSSSPLALASAFAICRFATSLHAEPNLSPKESVRDQEGVKFKQLEFADGAKTITYEPPRGWSAVAGSAKEISLYPPGKVQADASIRVIPTRAPVTLDEAGRKALQEQIRAMLPPGAEAVALIEEEPSPLQLNRHETLGATYAFTLAGQKLRMNILIAVLDDAELCFTFSSREADFQDGHAAFRGSLFTWQWL